MHHALLITDSSICRGSRFQLRASWNCSLCGGVKNDLQTPNEEPKTLVPPANSSLISGDADTSGINRMRQATPDRSQQHSRDRLLRRKHNVR